MASTKYFLRDPKADKETPIVLHLFRANKQTKIPTGESIHPKYWNHKEQKVKRSLTGSPEFNEYLKNFASRVEIIYLDFKTKGIEPTSEQIREVIKPKEVEKEADFFSLFESFIEIRKADPEFSANTIKHYRTSLKHLRNFSTTKKVKFRFEKIDNPLYDAYKKYLFGLQMQPNTVGNEIKYLKTFLQWATDNGHHDNLAFKNFKKPKEKTSIIVLTGEELEVLYNFDLSNNTRLERVRDIFVLGCYTGLRFSDLCNLQPGNIKGNYIELRTIKTKDPLKIPITPQAKAIILKYEGNLPKISNQKANEYLKELGKTVGLDSKASKVKYSGGKRIDLAVNKFELITTHTARRTFITLALKQGMPQVTLIKITGHKDLRTMQKYVEITEEDTYNAMMKAFGEIA